MSALQTQEKLLEKNPNYDLRTIIKMYQTIKREGGNDLNVLTWSRYEEPLSRAEKIDDLLMEWSSEKCKENLPLLGFVISIKDCIYVRGTPNTHGLMMNLDRVSQEETETIMQLKKAGAVITSKGNVPQILFSMESVNHVFGTAKHFLDPERTVGGSSGGEAALVAMGYNNAAIGTDLGGSLRIPTLFCGICSLKPSAKRLSNILESGIFSREYGSDCGSPQKIFPKSENQSVMRPVIGPMARTAEDLEQIMRVLCADQSFDPTVPPLPWRDNLQFPKRIGVVKEFSLCETCPAVKRAMRIAQNSLEKSGYELIELHMDEIWDEAIWLCLVTFNKNHYLNDAISGKTYVGEKSSGIFNEVKKMFTFPDFMLSMVGKMKKESRIKYMIDAYFASQNITNRELRRKQIFLYRKFEKRLTALGVSAILSPGLPVPAIKHLSSNQNMLICAYTFIWNYLDVPSGVATVTRVKEEEQDYETQWEDEMAQSLKENLKESAGLPVGVAISARAWQDEIVIQIMKDLQTQIGDPML